VLVNESLLDFSKRFSFGINLDDAWRYAGIKPPRSIVLPHLLSVSLPEGRIIDPIHHRGHGDHVDTAPQTTGERASLSLAEVLAQANVGFVRCWFPWRFFEPKPVNSTQLESLLDESYREWPLDRFVDILAKHGVGIVPVLACGYKRMLPRGLNPDPDRESYLKRASVHARLLVRKYKDKIKCWQIENEPNWWSQHAAGGWRSGLAWMHEHGFKQRLLQTLNESVHIEDPTALTIINLEADAKTLDPTSYVPYCDVLGLDFYPNYKTSSPINTSVFKLANEVAGQFDKPVIVSETGYPSGPLLLGYSASKQAEYVASACLDAFALDRVNAVGIWRYIDTSWRSFPDQENHFGLHDSKGNSKPAWGTLSRIITELK
jgi:hypothetical protein